MRSRNTTPLEVIAHLERGLPEPKQSRIASFARYAINFWLDQGAQLISDTQDSLIAPESVERQMAKAANRSPLTRDPVTDDEWMESIDSNVVIDRTDPSYWAKSQGTFYNEEDVLDGGLDRTADNRDTQFSGVEVPTYADFHRYTPAEQALRQSATQQN